MRKLVVSAFMTLDGVVQAPGGPEEDISGGFAHGGWTVPYWDDVMGKAMDAASAETVDLLLGRRTYEIFAAHWPHSDEEPMASKLNGAVKHVASRTLKRLDWHNSCLIKGDVGESVARLKQEDGHRLFVYGSADLVQTLLTAGLVDEFLLWTFPVVLGSGKRLFAQGTMPAALELTASQVSTTGVVIGTYRVAGPVRTGSFALEEPTEAEVARRAAMAGDA
ncbi:dihydrofolate reductase family protein [Leptolyngbya sp. 15MV]|nr:dihydrofolate reductase family protein [Leptolyngbya sp. 15MV]